MPSLRISFLIFSVLVAVAMIGLILLVATTPYAEHLRQANTHLDYLGRAIQTAESAVTVSTQSTPKPNTDAGDARNLHAQAFSDLDSALASGSHALAARLTHLYQPTDPLDKARWIGVSLLNWQDADVTVQSDIGVVVDLGNRISAQVENLTNQLEAYREEQSQFSELRASFTQQSNQLLSTLREQGKAGAADAIYVAGNKIEGLLTSSAETDLDRVFKFIGQLELLEDSLPRNQQASLRSLVNTTYTLNALKRSMNEAVLLMNTQDIVSNVEQLSSLFQQDQTYVSSAVSDARILLNISTILLLSLLAFLGRRLQSSYRALNASHDDLEVRVQDRTADLNRANEDLVESQVQLVQAEKMSSLGQLVAGVMHEINTPLLYVQNNTAMTAEAIQELNNFVEVMLPFLTAKTNDDVQSALKNLSSERHNFNTDELYENLTETASLAQDSREGLEQIGELVQSLKDFSRLDRMADDKFDVREGIEKTLIITRNLLKQGVEVVRDLEEVPEIFCSPSRLNQVFINLVTNSIQAMDGVGTLTIRTRWLHAGKESESVSVEFLDTGCGIAEEHLNKIMDPFFTTKPVGQGTGLGLSIVSQIVDQHQGQILVDSKVGVGTRITMNFPVHANVSALEGATVQATANDEEAA